MKFSLKKGFTARIVTVVDNNFLDELDKKIQKDESIVEKICSWLVKNYNFEEKHILSVKKDFRRQACLDYLVIGITSGEINEKAFKEYIKSLEQ